MKRGKDDEKAMGPMFPRLHVNDTEKGGPRAPPRNKMALYEQFSIPSQRFNRPEVMPPNYNNNANFVPSASSSQMPPSRQPEEKPPSLYLDSSATLAQLGQKKKSDEDDLRVPVFACSKIGQDSGKYHNRMDRENLSPSSPKYSIELQSDTNEDNAKDIVTNAKLDETAMDKARDPLKQADTSFPCELRNDPLNVYSRLQKTDSRLQPEQRTNPQPGSRRGHLLNTVSMDRYHENSSMSLRNYPSEEFINLDNVINDTESHEDRTCRSLHTINVDEEDDASETSMVDSVSEADISPDDVVGMIGQKHFWKARRAIVNQQRVFAIQVFELHRLIKVQRLIAESPHLLVEGSAYLVEPIKAASVKKLPLEITVKVTSNVSKHKSEKPNNKMECSAENNVGKASLSSMQNGCQPLNYGKFAGNTPLTPVTSEQPNMGPWGFPQPQGHQWLVPVMSPSEGLVYKPYPGPGFTGPVCGGCGPPGSTPVMGNFLPPAHGPPASHHQYQGTGVPTFVPAPGPHGFFPPYVMPVMNLAMPGHAVEQMKQFTTQGLQHQLSGGGANFSVQHQNSNNLPVQNSGVNTDALKMNAPKDSGLQVSTASSPTERTQDRLDNATDRSSVLPLFPPSAVTEGPSGSPRHREIDQTARVIRVVPHNGGLATESAAARIFHSIQKERKQYDSV